jgi:hypothetical protein
VRLIFYFILLFSSERAFAQIINIEERRIRGTNDSVHWYGAINFSGNLSKVRETVLQLNSDAQIEYKWKKHLWLSLTNYNLIKAGEKSFVNAGFEHLRYNYKLSKDYRLTWELYGQVQQNQVQLMALRRLWGTGLRYRLWDARNGQNRMYVGVSYLHEYNRFKNITEPKRFDRLSNYVTFTYRPNKVFLFINTSYFQPKLLSINQLRWSSETDLEFKITKHLSFRGAFNWNYDATLPVDIPRQTFSWLNGLKWTL